jgi:hypothetical protein
MSLKIRQILSDNMKMLKQSRNGFLQAVTFKCNSLIERIKMFGL